MARRPECAMRSKSVRPPPKVRYRFPRYESVYQTRWGENTRVCCDLPVDCRRLLRRSARSHLCQGSTRHRRQLERRAAKTHLAAEKQTVEFDVTRYGVGEPACDRGC